MRHPCGQGRRRNEPHDAAAMAHMRTKKPTLRVGFGNTSAKDMPGVVFERSASAPNAPCLSPRRLPSRLILCKMASSFRCRNLGKGVEHVAGRHVSRLLIVVVSVAGLPRAVLIWTSGLCFHESLVSGSHFFGLLRCCLRSTPDWIS